MKCLVVSYSFPPLNVISTQRVVAVVRHLAAAGFEVDVLTCVKSPVDGPIDDLSDFRAMGEVATIHEVGFAGRTAHDYVVTGQSGRVGVQSGAPRRFFKRVKNGIGRVLGSLFDYRTLWALPAVRYFEQHLASNEYDLVFTSSGPACVNYVGARIKSISPKSLWIADFRDMWSLLHSSGVTRLTRRVEMALERRLLKASDLITTVSSFLATQMRTLHRDSTVQVVRNGFEPDEMSAIIATPEFFAERGCKDRFNIVYAGSIYRGRRDPSALISAICASELRSKVALHFFGSNLEPVPDLVRKLSAEDFTHFHGNVPRRTILAIQKAADANLFLESDQEDARGVLTGKLFELAALERPVLAIGPQLDFESMVLLSGTGLLLHWESLGRRLEEVIAAAKRVQPNKAFIGTLNRDSQLDSVAAFVPHCAGQSTRKKLVSPR